MRWPSVCATGRPSRPRAFGLSATHYLSAPLRDAAAALRTSRALFRRTRGSSTITGRRVVVLAGGLPPQMGVIHGHLPGPTPAADYAPPLRSPWRAALVAPTHRPQYFSPKRPPTPAMVGALPRWSPGDTRLDGRAVSLTLTSNNRQRRLKEPGRRTNTGTGHGITLRPEVAWRRKARSRKLC